MMKQRSILLLFTAFMLGFFYSCSDTDIPSAPADEPEWNIEISVDSTIVAGDSFDVVVTVEDDEGNRLTGEEIILSLENGNFVNDHFDPIEGNISATTGSTENPGVATFNNLRVTEAADNYQLVANVVVEDERQQLKADIAGGEFRVVPAEASIDSTALVYWDDDMERFVDDEIEIFVKVKDEFNNHRNKDDDTVWITVINKGDTDKRKAEFDNGLYKRNYKFEEVTKYKINVTLNDDSEGQEKGKIVIKAQPGEPSNIELVNDGIENIKAGEKILDNAGEALQVRVKDSVNDALEGVNVSVSLKESDVTLNGDLTQATDGDGIATFNNLSINTAGKYRLDFQVEDNPGIRVKSNEFTIIPSDPHRLILEEKYQPKSNIEAGETILPESESAIRVRLQDEHENTISNKNVIVSLNDDTVELQGTEKQETDGNGVATFNNLSINTAGKYRLDFQVEDNPDISIESNEFTIIPSDPHRLILEEKYQPKSNIEAGETILPESESAISVRLQDEHENTISNQNVIVSLNDDTVELQGTETQETDGNGVATFNNLIINDAGNYILIFTVEGFPNVDPVESEEFTIIETE